MASSSRQNGHPSAMNGREKEYEQLVRVVCPAMATWLRRHVSDRYDREEILELTIIKGWEAYPTLKEKMAGRSWMMSILRHETSNYRRQEQRKGNRREGREEFDEELHSGTGTGTEDAIVGKIDEEWMKKHLIEGEMHLYELAKVGYKSTEIAAQLGTTGNAIRKRLSRMNKKIERLFSNRKE